MTAGLTDHHHFELRVIPDVGMGYGLALFQTPLAPGGGKEPLTRVVQLWGDPLRSVIDQVLMAIKRAGYRAADLGASRREPFRLKEEDGVRLGVLFLAVKPLRKLGRAEAISDQVKRMELEELFYWYSKSTAIAGGQRAQKALRLLLAEE